ncbi:hypothetical protein KC19_11G143200 [Ceratodon purpureus]|uniref:Kinesin-like protein KIN-8A n=1 Tax=Ceratodon purpureus TaxID=3225 RepID=A0A8T0GG41_CERPU|nr:hypothetical protein KC19_11G143200 [Ceratodon purpureus]
MPALVARSGATSPAGGNKIKVRDTSRKGSLLGDENVRRDVLHGGKDIKDTKSNKITDIPGTENRSTSKSLLLLKERVSRLGGGAGIGIGDGHHASPRAQDLQTHQGSLSNPVPRLNRQASQKETTSRLSSIQRKYMEMQENSDPPTVIRSPGMYSPQVLGAYNWAKEQADAFKQDTAMGEATKPAFDQKQINSGRISVGMPRLSLVTTPAPTRTATTPTTSLKKDSILKTVKVPPSTRDESELGSDSGGAIGTRIMVYVRARPLSKKEKEAGSRSCVRIVNRRDIYLTEFASETDYLRLKRVRGRHFAFDASFPDNTSQQEVYNASTAQLVEGVLQGKNGSVFCYGATGAGKTHTMLGTIQSPGVMVLALKDLFAKIKQRSKDGDHVVRLSYLEVYNETVRDLLSPGRPLVLREDSKQGIVAAGLTQYQAYSADEVIHLLQRGNLNRTTEPTRINETSSRSHAILQVVAEYKLQQETGVIVRVGKLSLIDLAGSERALATDQRTLRSVEGASINRSLLALSSCINALCEGKKHIPFRNSKLTQLLKDSLGGSCRTAMIANISLSDGSFGETQNTLHWADRAKEIRTKSNEAHEESDVPETTEDQSKIMAEMQTANQQLRHQLARLQQKYLAAQQSFPSHMATPLRTPSNCEARSIQEQDYSVLTPQTVTSPPFQDSRPTDLEQMNMDLHRKTPGFHTSLSEQEFPERVTAERTIRDLQRTIQLLEMEVERTKLELLRKDEKHSAAIAVLKQEHAMEVKAKDDIIEKLSQRSLCEPETSPLLQSKKLFLSASKEPRSAVTTHKTISRLSFGPESTSRNPMAIETIYSVPVAPASSPVALMAKQPNVSPIRSVSGMLSAAHEENLSSATRSILPHSKTDSLRRHDMSSRTPSPVVFGASSDKGGAGRVSLRPVRRSSNKIPSLPPIRQVVKESRPRVIDHAPRRMSIAHHPPRSPPLPRFFSPAKPGSQTVSRPVAGSTRKRSFWDINNTNSPPAFPVTRAARRLSVVAPSNTPSLLLQVLLSSERSYRAEFEDFNYC